jgi:cytoskeleton protein RodZ
VSDSVHDSPPEAIPELQQLGKVLHDARQQRGLSLSDLADRLHIGINQLHALETGDRSKLREPVFVVAQAKRVAGTLGVDIHQQLEDLRSSDLMRTPPRPHPQLAAPVHSEPRVSRSSRSAGTSSKGGGFGPVVLISALVVGGVALAVGLWMRPGGGDRPSPDPTAPSVPSSVPSPSQSSAEQSKQGALCHQS